MNGDTLWVWCYPSVASDLRQVLLSKCCLTHDSRDFHTFVFGQFCRTWYYITTVEVQEPTALNKVQNTPTHHQRIMLVFFFSFPLIKCDFFFLSQKGHSFFNSCDSKRLQPREVCGSQQNPLQVMTQVLFYWMVEVPHRAYMVTFVIQDVYQTRQSCEDDGSLHHSSHQRALSE